MSSVPGAPIPHTGPPSPPSNPWTLLAAVGGAVAIVAGVLVLLFGVAQANTYRPSPVPGLIGSALLGAGVLLLACALVLVGVGWYLRHPHDRA